MGQFAGSDPERYETMTASKKILYALPTSVAGIWITIPEAVKILLLLQALDVCSGLLAAWEERAITSRLMRSGIVRKSMCLIVIAAVSLSGSYLALDYDLAAWCACWFSGAELISIIENASRCGVPIPQRIRNVLASIGSKP